MSLLWLISLVRIYRLRRILRFERQRAKVPLLNLLLDDDSMLFALSNEGSCTAKDVRVQDILLELDYDFKKTLRLVFDPLSEIHPSQQKPLSFRIFEGEYELTKEIGDSFFAHLKSAVFSAQLQYKNYAGIPFVADIRKDKDHLGLDKVVSV